MGVLDDMLDDAGARPGPAATFGDVVARAVRRPAAAAAPAEAPSLDPLLALDEGALRRLLRYLPADAMVPLLARASVPVASRIVGLLDAESQAWLAAQSDAIEACTPQAHAAAARQALALIERARSAGPAPAPPPRPAIRPVELGVSFSSTPLVPDSPPPAPPTPSAGDDVVEALAALITAAAGRDPARLRELADAADHPVLGDGLRALAAGADAHALDEAVRTAGARWIEEQQRRVELMRLALLAIRFGDGPQGFRAAAAKAG